MSSLQSRTNFFKFFSPHELRPVWEPTPTWGKPGPRDAGSARSSFAPVPPVLAPLPGRSQREERTFTFYQPTTPPGEVGIVPEPSELQPQEAAPAPSSPLLPSDEGQDELSVDEHGAVGDSLQVLESDGEYEPAKKKSRSYQSGEESADHVEETVDDQPGRSHRHNKNRPLYLDALDIAEGRGQRYRNPSDGPSLDPETFASVKQLVGDFRLDTSKSPILDALIYCALKGWGMRLTKNEGDDIRITVDDFQQYYRCSAVICSKEHPTEDQAARIKALRRWFPDFPAKQDEAITYNQPFEVQVQRPASKDNKPRKLREIITRMKAIIAAENKRGSKRPRETE